MFRCIFTMLVCLVVFASNAYEFAFVVDNKSNQSFSVEKTSVIPAIKISDQRFSDNELVHTEIKGEPYTYFVQVSLRDYKNDKSCDVITFRNHSGYFRVSFSKPNSTFPYSFPVLLDDSDAECKELDNGIYHIAISPFQCGGYKIDIALKTSS